MALTLMLDKKAGSLLGKSEDIRAAIDGNFESDVSIEECAVFLAATLIGDAIERSHDIERIQKVEQELSIWSSLDVSEQRKMVSSLTEGNLDQDMLLTRCQWMMIMAQDLLIDKKIDISVFRILKDSIYGPLKGETLEHRRDVRLAEIVDLLN